MTTQLRSLVIRQTVLRLACGVVDDLDTRTGNDVLHQTIFALDADDCLFILVLVLRGEERVFPDLLLQNVEFLVRQRAQTKSNRLLAKSLKLFVQLDTRRCVSDRTRHWCLGQLCGLSQLDKLSETLRVLGIQRHVNSLDRRLDARNDLRQLESHDVYSNQI
nr:MAG TPA: hypothetical protein [Caudoviricetes sp.]